MLTSPLSPSSPDDPVVGAVQMREAFPFTANTIRQTVLRLGDPRLLSQLLDPAVSAPQSLPAMHRLVTLIRRLRRAITETDPSANHSALERSFTPEAILPYVLDEAYDVLDALHQEASGIAAGQAFNSLISAQELGAQERLADQKDYPQVTPPAQLPSPRLPTLGSSSLVTIDRLIPHLLWGIARSSYTLMQLIEGIRVRACLDGQTWVPGMLRLAVLLELVSPDDRCCFDVATLSPPGQLLDQAVRVQCDENLLPLRSSGPGSASQAAPKSGPIHRGADEEPTIAHQRQELLQQIQSSVPVLKTFLQGITLDWLSPGETWRSGNLRLNLGFEFIAQTAEAIVPLSESLPSLPAAEPVGDRAVGEAPVLGILPPSGLPEPKLPDLSLGGTVAVAALPALSLDASTLVRLTDPGALESLLQMALQHQLVQAISRFQQAGLSNRHDEALLQIVCAASGVLDRLDTLADPNISLLQPELLMDELVPKLLWQVTRSSYDVMRLVGGVDAEVLQPSQSWERGTLRLVAMLTIATSETSWNIDLASGHITAAKAVFLPSVSVVQLDAMPLCPFPIEATVLSQALSELVQATTPEIRLLMQPLPVEWLEADQDWCSGTLRLTLGLEFNPDPSHSVD